MQSPSSTSCKHIWSLFLTFTFLGLLLIVSACARIPNTIPFGYEDIVKDPAKASSAARVDYPIVYVVNPDDTSILIRVTKNGERFWIFEGEFWDQGFLKPVIIWHRFGLIAHGVENAICRTSWTTLSADVETEGCDLVGGATLNDYLSKPLIGILDYLVGDDNKPADDATATGGVTRLYYLIPDEK
jgi:hypothetical protein